MPLSTKENFPKLVGIAKDPASILIKTGASDEALFYQAPVLSRTGFSSFFVGFHQGSLLLDRLKLYLSLDVTVEFDSQIPFLASLSLAQNKNVLSSKNDLVAVALEVLQQCHDSVLAKDRICPIT